MDLIKKMILTFLGLWLAISLSSCDDQEIAKQKEGEKSQKELRYHRKW